MKVLVLLPLTATQRKTLEAGAPDAEYTYVVPLGEWHERAVQPDSSSDLSQFDVIVGNLLPKRLGEATNLKFMQLNSAGYDNYLAAGTLSSDTLLANAGGAYGQAVSEHLFAMVLSQMKHLELYRDTQHAHEWAEHGPVTTMLGARVLVIGAGDIGSHFAKLCAAMGARVDGVRHTATPTDGFENVFATADLLGQLPNYDVVTSFVPSTAETKGLANAEFFSAMKEGAYFVNGGRGDLVDQDALVATLESGHLAGASLDVTTPEPLSADSPLWDAPNCFITPHVSGGFHLDAVLNNICAIAAENLAHIAAGEPIRNNVAH